MTWFEVYAFLGTPMLVLLMAAGLYWWTGYTDRRDRRADPTQPPPSSTPR